MTGNGNYVNLLNLAWKNSWNHFKWIYYWRVLAIWDHFAAGGCLELKRSQSLTHDSSSNSETNNKNSNEHEQFGIVERSKSFSASWAILQTATDPKTCQNTMSHETSQQPCPALQQEQVQQLPLKRNSFGSVTLRRQHTLRGKLVNKYMYTMY